MQNVIQFFATMGVNGILFSLFALAMICICLFMVFGKPITVKTTYIKRELIMEEDEELMAPPPRRRKAYDQHKSNSMFFVYEGGKQQGQS